MRVKKVFWVLGLLVAAGLVAAQTNTPPKVSVKIPPSAKAGQSVEATVTLVFADGLHGYQNPPTKDYLIPVSVTVSGAKLKSAKYPKGKPEKVGGEDKPVNVYEGSVKIPVTIVLPKKHGKTKLNFAVHYQQCNEASCYPPGDLTAGATVLVK